MALFETIKSGHIIGLKIGLKSHLPHPYFIILIVLEYGVCYEAMTMGKTSLNKCFTGHCGKFFLFGRHQCIETKKPHNITCYKVFKGGRWD